MPLEVSKFMHQLLYSIKCVVIRFGFIVTLGHRVRLFCFKLMIKRFESNESRPGHVMFNPEYDVRTK